MRRGGQGSGEDEMTEESRVCFLGNTMLSWEHSHVETMGHSGSLISYIKDVKPSGWFLLQRVGLRLLMSGEQFTEDTSKGECMPFPLPALFSFQKWQPPAGTNRFVQCF